VIASTDFFEEAPCGYVVIGPHGDFLKTNRAFGDLIGRTPGSLKGCQFQSLLSRAGWMFYETQFAQVILVRGKLDEVAFDLLTPAGQKIPVLINAVVRRDSAGVPQDILMAVFDASQRRSYEQELLEGRKIADQMVEVIRHSSDAILSLSTQGEIQAWNKGAERIFGYRSSEAKGQSLFTFLFQAASSREVREAAASLDFGRGGITDAVGRHKNGREIELSITLAPHMEAPGILVAYSAIIRDVSLQKAAERALIQSEKLASVGRLASSIAHEINNPLEAVTNLLYLLQSEVTSDAARQLVTTAQDELARVSHITNHTLRFHRQSSNKTNLNFSELFTSILGLYRARLESSCISVEVRGNAASPLLCFEGELRQIMVNLISNAFDAMRKGGRLILASRNSTLWTSGEQGVRVTIADSGIGMKPEVLSHIFEAFYTTKGIGGIGLGLWITHELVEKNKGHLKVRSSTIPGKTGTVFVLTFPHDAA
jgi:PAS domain S-box-containing protein